MLTRRFLLRASSAFAFPWSAAQAAAAAIPGVTKLMIGFPAGTSVDAIGRRYANKLQGRYAETLIVENRQGAAGRIALEQFKRAAPDGRTLMLLPSPLLTLYPFTYSKLKYDPLNDFIPVATVYQSSMGIAVGPAVPANIKTVAQFVEWVKSKKERIFFSANAQGAGPHFMGLQFAQQTGIEMDYVPYQGGTPAMNALMAGELPMVCISMGTLAPLAKSGKLRILASFDAQRNPLYPDVPTLKESGYPSLVENETGVIVVPAKTPPKLVAELEESIAHAMAQTDLRDGMRAQFLSTNFLGSADTTAAIKAGLERHRKLVASSQFTPME